MASVQSIYEQYFVLFVYYSLCAMSRKTAVCACVCVWVLWNR